ncbi:hypothetical protein EDB89DRAFT_1912716 [Lactarius sanguifluus]|nr:hypothetical protein EDB89DRAFT_1912716 [Lactarius sanguifluus]
MHVFDAGLFQTHCRQVWGIGVSAPSGDGTFSLASKDIPRPPDAELEKYDHDLHCAGNKQQLAEAIAEWVGGFLCTQTDTEGEETRGVHEGGVATDDSLASVHAMSEERIPTADKQMDINKCTQQLVNRAAANTVLRAKKAMLQFVCRDFCRMSQDELSRLCTKDELYAAATAWDVMEAIWEDMALTELPSWVTTVPHNWGTAARGKLSTNNCSEGMICSQPSQLGKLESTFMCSSMREANLQALLSDNSEVRSHIGNLTEVYKAVLAEDVRGTCLAHMVNAVHLTDQEPYIAYDETRLCESTLPDNMLAAFLDFMKGERFGFAGGFLCQREVAPPAIIQSPSIIPHAAVTPLQIDGQQVLHILPMGQHMRVSFMHTEDAEPTTEWGSCTYV